MVGKTLEGIKLVGVEKSNKAVKGIFVRG